MYIDWTFKKIATLSVIVLVLFSLVYSTHLAKLHTFGTTPYFYAINTGSTYLLESFLASVGNPRGKLYASAAAAFGFNTDKKETSDAKARAIPVLTYHRIVEDDRDENNVTVERFRDQMTTLHDAGWHAITLQEFEDFMSGTKTLPEKSFLLTFDDGAKQSFYPVDPILKKLGFNAAIYIIVESSHTKESTYYLAQEEIRWLLKTGRWAIGSHSYDGHRPYATGTNGSTGIFFADRIWNHDTGRLENEGEFATRVRNDLARAKDELARTYTVPVDTFAFPLGNETGILGANNYAPGASVTEEIARSIYTWGFIQTNNQDYTFNFPQYASSTLFEKTGRALASNFLVHRIHVDYDWDGARLLSIMENGRAKDLPYEDDFTENRGWIPAWGSLESGRNNLTLAADPTITSASTFLDGSALWDAYSFDASVNWQVGHVSLLADVLDSKTYHSCAFSEGIVRLQRTIDGETETLAEKQDPRIAYGDAVRPGIRVHDAVIECTWNFESILEDYSRDFSGGVGIQIWDPELGRAQIQVVSVLARSL